MKLYFSPTSPYVRKVLIAAEVLGLMDRIQFLPAAAHPINRDRTLVGDNPLGKVPTLVLDSGLALFDSRVICEYLDEAAGGGKLFPRDRSRWALLAQQALADGILDAAILVRYETTVRPEPLRWADWTAGQLDKIRTSLAALEAAPPGPSLEIGSLTAACALWYLDLRYPELAWRDTHPALAAWLASFAQAHPVVNGSWALPAA